LLAAEDDYDSKSCWYFEAQVCRVQDSFECVQESSSEDGVIWVRHVNHIEGDVFDAGVLGSAEGLDSLFAEAIEGHQRFPELLPVKSHFVKCR
jgi:hypothetical protein